jgi:PAS domain S-box
MTSHNSHPDFQRDYRDSKLAACLLAAVRDSAGKLIDLRFKLSNQALTKLFPNAGIVQHVELLSYLGLPYFPDLLEIASSVLDSGKADSFAIHTTDSRHPYRCRLYRTDRGELIITLSLLIERSKAARRDARQEGFPLEFFDSGPIKFIISPTSGRILEVNTTALNFYGWTRRQFRSLTIDQVDAGSAEQIAAGIAAVEERGYAILHVLHRLSSGELRSVEVHASTGRWNGERVHFSIVLERRADQKDLPRARAAAPATQACIDAGKCFGPFLERYSRFIPELEALMANMLPYGHLLSYGNGEHFLEFGGLSPNIGFIVSGFFRQYTLTEDGRDFTLGLYRPGQIIDTFAYAEFGKPCPLAFEARCASEVFIINRKFLLPLSNSDPRWWKLFYYNLSSRLITRNEREISLLSDDAATRYRRFLNNDEDAIPYLQSYHIASYLGVTSETLSRIRRKGRNRPSSR